MSSVAVNASQRTPAGSGAQAIRRNSGESPRSARERCPECDDRVDLSGEATTCDGLRDHNTAEAVAYQMHLVRAGLRQHPGNLRGELISYLLHRGAERRVAHGIKDQTPRT
jgi:hypothetical protein